LVSGKVRKGASAAVAVDRSERPLRVRNLPLGDAPLDQLLFRVIKSVPGTDPGESHVCQSRSSFPLTKNAYHLPSRLGLAHSVLAVRFGTAGLVNLWLDEPAPIWIEHRRW
jgi:hypothetical protein